MASAVCRNVEIHAQSCFQSAPVVGPRRCVLGREGEVTLTVHASVPADCTTSSRSGTSSQGAHTHTTALTPRPPSSKRRFPLRAIRMIVACAPPTLWTAHQRAPSCVFILSSENCGDPHPPATSITLNTSHNHPGRSGYHQPISETGKLRLGEVSHLLRAHSQEEQGSPRNGTAGSDSSFINRA